MEVNVVFIQYLSDRKANDFIMRLFKGRVSIFFYSFIGPAGGKIVETGRYGGKIVETGRSGIKRVKKRKKG